MKIGVNENGENGENGWKCIFNKTGFKVFCVIMKRNPIITNFKRTIYQTFK